MVCGFNAEFNTLVGERRFGVLMQNLIHWWEKDGLGFKCRI